jgi:hypothetical protein
VSRGSEPDARALRRMVRELQGDATPDLDWDRIEGRLFGEIGVAAQPGEPEADIANVALGASSPARTVAEADAAAVEPMGILVSGTEIEDELAAPSQPPALASRARASRDSVIDLSTSRGGDAGRISRGAVALVSAFAVAAGVLLGFGLGGGRASAPIAQRDPIDSEALPLAGYSAPDYGSAARQASTAGGVAPEPPQVPGADEPVRELASLRSGDLVEASAGPVSFGELGVLTWTLSPGGRVSVVSDLGASPLVLALESGSLSAEVSGDRGLVVQSAGGEVVTTRGVIFSVTRSSRGLFVQVEQGAVTVGASGGAGERHLVEAPHRGKLASDGYTFELVPGPVAARAASTEARVASNDRAAERLAPKTEDAAPTDDRAPRSVDAPRAAALLASAAPQVAAPPEAARPASAPLGEGAIRSRLMRCLVDARAAARDSSPDGVTVTVSSTLRIKVDESGAVKAASFTPPLLPELQSCAVFLFHERLEPGARAVSIPVQIP